jgi:hypothetical protein
MNTIVIPNNLIKEKELVVISRQEYKRLIGLQKKVQSLSVEERDTDIAVKTYKKEKRLCKLKTIASLANLRG